MTGYVYFIGAVESRRIKIGYSINPITRLASLQTASPEQLELLGCIPGSESLERQLHARHEQYRLHGEWFQPGAGLIADIIHCLGLDRPTPQQVESMAKANEARRQLEALRVRWYGPRATSRGSADTPRASKADDA